MMCSTWKISVFGIVALILAFGIATTDVEAQTRTVGVGLEPTNVNAAAEITALTFKITVDKGGDDDPATTIVINIPPDWPTKPIEDNADGEVQAGEVTFSKGAASGKEIGRVSGRNLRVMVGEKAGGNGVYNVVYKKATAPSRARDYTFPISGADNQTITVGAAVDGSGKIELSRTNGTLYRHPNADDTTPAEYKNDFIFLSEEELSLMVKYTVAGTMPKNSEIILTVNADIATFTRHDNTEVSVGGNVTGNLTVTRDSQTVEAKVKDGALQAGNTIIFHIKKGKAPKTRGDDVNDGVKSHDGAIQVTSAVDQDGGDTDDPGPATAVENSPFNFVTTAPAGTGKLQLNLGGSEFTHVVTGTELTGNITFTFPETDKAGIGQGSKFEFQVPSAWTEPFDPIDEGSTTDGAFVGGDIDGRKVTGNLTTPPGTISYRMAKAPAEGMYPLNARGTAGPHTDFAALAGSPTLHVTAKHGSGTLVVTHGGGALTQTTSEADLGRVQIIYTPAGYMVNNAQVIIKAPVGWPAMREDNGDGSDEAGEVTFDSGKAKYVLSRDTADNNRATITLTATEAWSASDRFQFTYKGVKVPKVDGTATHSFTSQTQSFNGKDLLADGPKHNIGIGRSPDGGGTIGIMPASADAGSTIDVVITFIAQGRMESGSEIVITIPDGWPDPTGNVSLSTGAVGTTTATMTATTSVVLNTGDTVVFTWSGVTVPAAGRPYTFTAQSKSHPSDGVLTSLSAGATIDIDEVAAGSVMLTNAAGDVVDAAAPDMALGDLTITFEAGAAMATGSVVEVTIPVGWTAAFLDNNDGTDTAGEVSVAGAATLGVSGGGGTPWVLTAVTNAGLAIGDTLVLTYKDVSAPSSEATYTFTTKASLVSGGTLLPLKPQPQVIVRLPITALAIATDPDPASVFVGETIEVTVTLWDAGDGTDTMGQALNSIIINLDDGEADGTFEPASITIPAGGHSMSATYTNDAAADSMITATAADKALGLDSVSIPVVVKSGITEKSVSPDPASAGTIVTIAATGEAGAQASFSYSYVNADGNSVSVQKGMDPVGDPVDGSQKYVRENHALPGDIPEGDVMVTVTIASRSDTVSFEVINDQTPPTLTNAEASQSVVVNGDNFTLSVDVAMNESMTAITSVMADVSMLDDTQMDDVVLTELGSSPGTYATIITVGKDNTAEDGEKTITIAATDRIGNSGTAEVMITLENDPSELTSAEVTPASGKPGDTIWIKASGSKGGDAAATVKDAESGMMIAQVTLDEDAANPGMYSAGFMIVEDAHPAGMYDVTVTLGTQMMTLEGALTIEPPGYDFTLSIGAGTHLIHVPLAVTQVNGADMEIATVRDLYNALGDAVNIIISLGADGSWNSYLGDDAPGMAFGDMMLGDSTGLVAVMNSAVTLELTGNALGTGGVSTIMLNAGNNLVGVPLDSAQISMISDVLGTLVSAVVVSNEAGDGFQTITQAGDPGDGPLMGGEGYIVVAAAAASIPVIGSPWQNMDGGMMSAPPVASGANVKTPVLHVRGQLVDEAGMMSLDGLNVSVRNVTDGSVLGSSVATDEYSMTFVKLNSSAAKVGDILEIKADSGNPLLGIRPVQHVVTAEDVLNGSISLPDLVTYEIPAQSELLANYPNPFNPETWIPFRLAEDASVSLDIYGASGALVRTIDLGFTPAAVYEGRSDAIYWDGRNNFGEQVSSGLYFYHLRAGEFSATRRMVVVK